MSCTCPTSTQKRSQWTFSFKKIDTLDLSSVRFWRKNSLGQKDFCDRTSVKRCVLALSHVTRALQIETDPAFRYAHPQPVLVNISGFGGSKLERGGAVCAFGSDLDSQEGKVRGVGGNVTLRMVHITVRM